jgi:peroxiredoxin Q/BCP
MKLLGRRWLSIFGGMSLFCGSAVAALKVGDPAPDFSAPSTSGETVQLQKVLKKAPIVLYFYPKDDTPGCTKEACNFRDGFAAFRKLKATIYGISYDSIKSHMAFKKKYHLPFELLSDADKKIAKAYGADNFFFARRMTFVIDAQGKIAYINPSVNPATHSEEMEKVLGGVRH